VPVRDVVAGEFAALLENEALALAAPLACGVKVNVKDTLCPAASVTGNVSPLSENSAVLMLALDTVTLDPLAVSVEVVL
jgi:hypothetical protein